MKLHPRKFLLRVVCLLLILAAGLLTLNGFREFHQVLTMLQNNSKWGVADVGGLTPEEAQQPVLAVYLSPFELSYQGQIIQTPAEEFGFAMSFFDGWESY